MDQGSSFISEVVKEFCNTEVIKIVYSSLNNHRATGYVERTLGSIKNSILTYVKEEKHGNLRIMVERAPGALRFAPTATIKMWSFEAHHAREANTVLGNLIEKSSLQNLNWNKKLRQKFVCLDTNEPRAQKMPNSARKNWNIRSEVEYDPENMNRSIKLTGNLVSRQGSLVGRLRTVRTRQSKNHLDDLNSCFND